MISKDVPTAIGISTPSIITRAGMMRNPPPTPNRPVSSPTATAAGIDRGAQRRQLIPPALISHAPPVSSESVSMRIPATTMTTANPTMMAVCGR